MSFNWNETLNIGDIVKGSHFTEIQDNIDYVDNNLTDNTSYYSGDEAFYYSGKYDEAYDSYYFNYYNTKRSSTFETYRDNRYDYFYDNYGN